MKIPFAKISLGVEEEQAVIRVMRSGWLAAGEQVSKFEEEFSNYISPKEKHYYCIFTSSCTSALKMAYKFFKEVKGYDKFVCQDNTFCATYAAGIEMGLQRMPTEVFTYYSAVPMYVRVAVHYGGVLSDWKNLTYSPLIEDSAHRIEPNDPLIGNIRCYSFYATKNMTTGSGGMFVTNSKEIYEKCRLYWKDGLSTSTYDRQHGKGWNYKVEVISGGYDGNDISASIGRIQLKKLPVFTSRRNQIRDKYNRAFNQDWSGNHLYPYFVSSEEEVAKFIQYMKDNGISCGYHYPGNHWLGVSLPIFPDLTEKEQNYIINKVLKYEAT